MIEMDLMQDFSEVIRYNHKALPLYIHTSPLSAYPGRRALCHWHEDLEFVRIREGKMNYYVNGRKILLKKDDCFLVNSRQMHYGYSSFQEDCIFTCFLFHPSLFSASDVLRSAFLLPLTEHAGLEFLHFPAGEPLTLQVLALLDSIASAREERKPGYELEIVGDFHLLFSCLFRHGGLFPPKEEAAPSTDLVIQKTMVSYICQNYARRLTLPQIAASGHVGKNKCCQIFRKYLLQSPIDFLNSYRLKVSCHLLASTRESVTDIALSCGFNHLSYYSKLFCRHYGCTPSEYREQNTEEAAEDSFKEQIAVMLFCYDPFS